MQITESKTSFHINALEIHGGNTNAIEIQVKHSFLFFEKQAKSLKLIKVWISWVSIIYSFPKEKQYQGFNFILNLHTFFFFRPRLHWRWSNR